MPHFSVFQTFDKQKCKHIPNCLNKKLTQVPVTGREADSGGWSACLSLAPMENLTWGPPDGGTWMQPNILPINVSRAYGKFSMYTV